jgi:hypothetical protein
VLRRHVANGFVLPRSDELSLSELTAARASDRGRGRARVPGDSAARLRDLRPGRAPGRDEGPGLG